MCPLLINDASLSQPVPRRIESRFFSQALWSVSSNNTNWNGMWCGCEVCSSTPADGLVTSVTNSQRAGRPCCLWMGITNVQGKLDPVENTQARQLMRRKKNCGVKRTGVRGVWGRDSDSYGWTVYRDKETGGPVGHHLAQCRPPKKQHQQPGRRAAANADDRRPCTAGSGTSTNNAGAHRSWHPLLAVPVARRPKTWIKQRRTA